MRVDSIVTTKGNMNQSTFVGIHRRQGNTFMSANSALGSGLGHRSNLVLSTALITFDVDDDRIPKAKLATHQQGEHNLKSIEGTSMAANENSKIRSSYVQDQLALVALILIDRRVGGIEVRKDGTQDGNSNIGNGVELLIGQLFTSL